MAQAAPTKLPVAPPPGISPSIATNTIKPPIDSVWNHIDKKTGSWKVTGFNPRHLHAAAKQMPGADPWARNEAWRSGAQFSTYNRLFKGSFPGIGIGFGLFVAYSVYEAVFAKEEHHH